MKVGSLIKYYNPPLGDDSPKALVGLVLVYDRSAQGSPNIKGRGMLKVLFNGFKFTRWVHEQQCEVISESR